MSGNTRNYFDEKAKGWISESYDSVPTIAQTRLSAILNFVLQQEPQSILDVGCGDGRFLRLLDNISRRAGIDYSQQMIDLASASNPGISFSQIDLNSEQDQTRLHQLGQYDVITMLGVVHYLQAPSRSLSGLTQCCHQNTSIAVSFRNRLLNAKADSKYFNSPLNKRNIERLEKESAFWSQTNLNESNFLSDFKSTPTGQALIEQVLTSGDYEGVTDNFWNPDGFENWRQFTPLDAILLLDKAGLETKKIIPLVNDPNEGNLADGATLSYCSSFIVVGKMRASI